MNPSADHMRLVKRTVARDPVALAHLYDLFGDVVYRVAYRMMECPEDAEDIVQDVFLGLPTALETFENRGSLEGWIRRVTVRTVLMKLRSQRSRKQVFLKYAATALARFTKPSLDDHITFETLLAELPESQRVVLVLRLEGYTHGEISRALGISVSSAKMRYHRACKRIRPLLLGLDASSRHHDTR
jgi:RNA polymerase sigma-70 factor (ECF subfamily)